MLDLGFACSHVGMKDTVETWLAGFDHRLKRWPELQDWLPLHTRQETKETMQNYINRIDRIFENMRKEIQAYKPDALVIVGGDQNEVFDHANVPMFGIFTADRLWGPDAQPATLFANSDTVPRVDYRTNPELAQHIAKELVARDFDLSIFDVLKPRGIYESKGLGHMVSNIAPVLDPGLKIPIIPFYINVYFPHRENYYSPLPSAERCYNIGRALGEILRARPERIMICASGGLSHPASGGVPRTKDGGLPGRLPLGYVDEVLDRAFLQCIERHDAEAMKKMFAVPSEVTGAGTGELRSWITVAGAMARPGKVLDYMAAMHMVTGLGYAWWPPTS